MLETAELLYEYSDVDAYRAWGFDAAKKYVTIYPVMPWAYSFAARFAPTTEQRIPYLATALRLDSGSYRANQASSSDIELAERWLASHRPLHRGKAEADAI